MMFLKRHILTLVTAFCILMLSVMHTSSLPRVALPGADKVVHLSMYALLAIALLFDRRFFDRLPIDKWYLYAPLIAVVYGLLMEIVQQFLPWRSFSLFDIFANSLGALIGTLLFALVSRLYDRL